MPAAGDVVLASHIEDLKGFVRKTVDESVTSSTVLQNDNELLFAIDEVGTYVFDLYLFGSSAANAAGDLTVGFTFPTGTLHAMGNAADTGLASGVVQTGNWGGLLSMTSGVTFFGFGLSTTVVGIHVHGILIATATGTLQVQWAQQVSNANASTVKAGSHMLVKQVA